jgi:hypothetical protein
MDRVIFFFVVFEVAILMSLELSLNINLHVFGRLHWYLWAHHWTLLAYYWPVLNILHDLTFPLLSLPLQLVLLNVELIVHALPWKLWLGWTELWRLILAHCFKEWGDLAVVWVNEIFLLPILVYTLTTLIWFLFLMRRRVLHRLWSEYIKKWPVSGLSNSLPFLACLRIVLNNVFKWWYLSHINHIKELQIPRIPFQIVSIGCAHILRIRMIKGTICVIVHVLWMGACDLITHILMILLKLFKVCLKLRTMGRHCASLIMHLFAILASLWRTCGISEELAPVAWRSNRLIVILCAFQLKIVSFRRLRVLILEVVLWFMLGLPLRVSSWGLLSCSWCCLVLFFLLHESLHQHLAHSFIGYVLNQAYLLLLSLLLNMIGSLGSHSEGVPDLKVCL